MDLRQLTHLIAVSEHHSFSAAARALHTVQSNVSTHVARLEKELGVQLVDRRTMDLTPEGAAVIERAQRIQAELQAINDDVVSMRDQVSGTVRAGIIGTTARWLLPYLLETMTADYAGVHLVAVDATTTSLAPQLLSGRLELAVVQGPLDDPDIDIEPLFDEERIIMTPLSHPLAEHDTVTVAQLGRHQLLLPPVGNTFRDTVDAETRNAGVELEALAEVDGMRLLASLTIQGVGPSLVPASAAPGYLVGNWKRVRVEGLSRRSVGLGRERRANPSAPARAVRDAIRTVVATAGRAQPGVHVDPEVTDWAAGRGN